MLTICSRWTAAFHSYRWCHKFNDGSFANLWIGKIAIDTTIYRSKWTHTNRLNRALMLCRNNRNIEHDTHRQYELASTNEYKNSFVRTRTHTSHITHRRRAKCLTAQRLQHSHCEHCQLKTGAMLKLRHFRKHSMKFSNEFTKDCSQPDIPLQIAILLIHL